MTTHFVFDGPIVPFTRMTQKTKFYDKAKKYLEYKGRLSAALKKAYPQLIVPSCPPSVTKKQDPEGFVVRAKWESTYKGLIYKVLISANTHNALIDSDNITKCVKDALQDSGLVPNDRQIKLDLIWLTNDKGRDEGLVIRFGAILNPVNVETEIYWIDSTV